MRFRPHNLLFILLAGSIVAIAVIGSRARATVPVPAPTRAGNAAIAPLAASSSTAAGTRELERQNGRSLPSSPVRGESDGASAAGNGTDARAAAPGVEVAPLPGWPKWVGDQNHQISGLAFRDGHLYGVSDQAGAWKRAILEIGLDGDAASRTLPVKIVCRWSGGPHPDVESLAIDPLTGPPRAFLMTLESEADAIIEVRAGTCEYLGTNGPLTEGHNNEGIEGLALSPDGRTLYMTHETKRTLMKMTRGEPGPATVVARIRASDSLCDAAYDDRGTASTEDDRLLLLDRNGLQILATTTGGELLGTWTLTKKQARIDPDGSAYGLISFEGLAIESRGEDGSTLVYLATDPPPKPFPYHRKDSKDPDGRYGLKVGMLYRYRLPPLGPAPVRSSPASASPAPSGSAGKGGR